MPEIRPARSGISRYYFMPLPVKLVFLATTLTSIILFVYFLKGIPVAGMVLSGTRYVYLLFAVLGFNVFMGLGATRRQKNQAPPWYDYILALILAGILIYFLINYEAIEWGEWDRPNTMQFGLALILGIISLEAGRRVGGWGFVILLLFSIIYPNFADRFSGIFWGMRVPLNEIFAGFAYGADGLRGLPGVMLGTMILGFYFFAGVMMGMGGGEFFLKLATSLLGQVRGGPAKVAVLASGFFGSLSGSIIANIAGTGAFTIPAMKRMGYPPHYAGAIEGCASSGGDTMPPIMGGMVFMAAYITGEDYADIMIAAFLPTMLYYFGLLVQVDGYAAKVGLRGLPKVEIPKLLPTLAAGWLYVVCLVFLVMALIYFRWGYISPIYATGLMILLTLLQGGVRLWYRRSRGRAEPDDHWRGVRGTLIRRSEEALVHTAGLINFGVAVFLAMSFILVGLFKTGTAGALTAWIVQLGAGNVYLVLFIAMLFNMLMGMVGLQRASYLFLAVTMAPAVVQMADVPIILVHLFIIFYAGLGGLTPPVAINAFIAASIAGADPMKTAWMSMHLGIVLLFVPFFFVLQPALALIGRWQDILRYTSMALLGIFILTSGLEGYLVRVGNLRPWERLLLVAGGFMIAFPELWTTLAGLGIAAAGIALAVIRRRLFGAKVSESRLVEYLEYPETVNE
jgi:TRAP transporter 4TM/12TM fusion protein